MIVDQPNIYKVVRDQSGWYRPMIDMYTPQKGETLASESGLRYLDACSRAGELNAVAEVMES